MEIYFQFRDIIVKKLICKRKIKLNFKKRDFKCSFIALLNVSVTTLSKDRVLNIFNKKVNRILYSNKNKNRTLERANYLHTISFKSEV